MASLVHRPAWGLLLGVTDKVRVTSHGMNFQEVGREIRNLYQGLPGSLLVSG